MKNTPASQRTNVSRDDISRRAYEIYISKGRQPGQCDQNWLQAERELREQSEAADDRENQPGQSSRYAGSDRVTQGASGGMSSNTNSKDSTRGNAIPVSSKGRDAKT